MVQLNELIVYTDKLLSSSNFRDSCPNGLQVEGRPVVRRMASGVTASLALIESAVELDADALLVHHGYFWGRESPPITGMKRERIRRLLAHDISLIAYHLPLDAHPVYGNNAQLAGVLGLRQVGDLCQQPAPGVSVFGELEQPVSGAEFATRITATLGREPLHISGRADPIRTIGWCTGAGQGYIEQAARQGLDAYLTGEVSEQTVHVARETGVHFFAAGHHATERYGVQALGAHLAAQFNLTHTFIDIENPA